MLCGRGDVLLDEATVKRLLPYDRGAAVRYARRWAYGRNPAFYDYEKIGGDCTNFASQCVYAGSGVMNYTKDLGWYYINANDKAPAWTGVEYFYNFMTREGATPGPIAVLASISQVMPGDVVPLTGGCRAAAAARPAAWGCADRGAQLRRLQPAFEYISIQRDTVPAFHRCEANIARRGTVRVTGGVIARLIFSL